jgi:hypothetical protein
MLDVCRERSTPGLTSDQPRETRTKISIVTAPAFLSQEARYYALGQLARRAGVTPEFFRSWRVESRGDETIVHLEESPAKQIRFVNTPKACWRGLTAGRHYTARASWMFPPAEGVEHLIPDFVVPFCYEKLAAPRPLFSPIGENGVACSFDLLASALLTLSRYEETASTERDAHGRFPARHSIAVRDGFLGRPIVDEYGLALEQALTYLLPGWRPAERRLCAKISHDIDWTGLPINPAAAALHIGHMIRRRKPLATARDLFGWAVGREPAYLKSVREIVRPALERELDSAVYWMAAPTSLRDSGYDPRHPMIQDVITQLQEAGVEMGVHPGYRTFSSPDQLSREVQTLRRALGEQLLGGRQHYLRWSPDTWLHWEQCGLLYDSTVGYTEQVGFRAGTCIPYRPWILALEREANLIEIPLLVMDGTLIHHMGLTQEESLDTIRELIARCRAVGGIFTLLWHNSSLSEPAYGDLYSRILDILAGCEKPDWKEVREGCSFGPAISRHPRPCNILTCGGPR